VVIIGDIIEAPLTWPMRFWRLFTGPGCRHVFLLKLDGPVWLSLDSKSWGGEMAIIRDHHGKPARPDSSVLDWFINAGARIFMVAPEHDLNRVVPRGLLTCVSVAKHLAGIRAWWVITPGQLERYFERRRECYEYGKDTEAVGF